MPNRSWYCAYQGQQHGPFPEDQFREFIASGKVRADTLVWNENMVDWQRAGDIPDLIGPTATPPAVSGRAPAAPRAEDSGALSIDFEILDFAGRLLLFIVGAIFIVPLPWVLVSNLKWITSRLRVPGRSGLDFTGKVATIIWWYFGAIAVIIALHLVGGRFASLISSLIEVGLGWFAVRWLVANLASAGEPLALSFSGSFWAYLGWSILGALSVITIIGWAWVYTAQMRWMCRNIEGTRREIVFKATGLEYLWRVVVVLLGCILIIPIPWAMRWMMRWLASQTVLVERDAHAGV